MYKAQHLFTNYEIRPYKDYSSEYELKFIFGVKLKQLDMLSYFEKSKCLTFSNEIWYPL